MSVSDLSSGEKLAELKGHQGSVFALAFSPDGRYLISGGKDQTIRLWDIEHGKQVRVYTGLGSHVRRVAFSPDGRSFAGAGYRPDFYVWDIEQSQPVRQFVGHEAKPTSFAFTPDSRYIITGSPDKTLRVWNVSTGRELARFHFDHYVANLVALVPNSYRVVTAGGWDMLNLARTGDGDYAVYVWELPEELGLFGEAPAASTNNAAPKPGTLRKFAPAEKPITRDGVTAEDGAWRIDAREKRTVRLFEVPKPGVEDCTLAYRAKIKTKGLKGKAYLEMWCRLPGRGEFFSKDLSHAVSGTTDWASCQAPFLLEKGQRPDLVKLNLVVEGKGTVWIKDIELLKATR